MRHQHQLADLSASQKGGDWRWAFLERLAETCCVAAACLKAGVSRNTAYQHREKFPRFRAKWDEAIEIGVEMLELQCRRRAFNGPEDPGSIRALLHLLRSHKPGKHNLAPGVDLDAIVSSLLKHVPEEAHAAVLAGLNKELGADITGKL